jgi:hypothetical protein
MMKFSKRTTIKFNINFCCDKTNERRSKTNNFFAISSHFDVKSAVKRVAYFQTVCPDFIITKVSL